MLTSGGDCPGLNAVLRGVVLAAEKLGWEVIGFRDGFEGLLPPGDHVVLDRKSTEGIMALGGTIIGTTNRGHFIAKVGAGDRAVVASEVIARAKTVLDGLNVKALVIVGGDGSMTTAMQMQEAGIDCIGVPKTIDNDIEATAMTFGFDSAVAECTPEGVHVSWEHEVDSNIRQRIKQLMHAEVISPALNRLVRSPEALDVAESILGPDISLFHCKLLMKAARDGTVTPWHQDYSYWITADNRPLMLNCMLQIDDATVENGCLQVVPASHKKGLMAHERAGKVFGRERGHGKGECKQQGTSSHGAGSSESRRDFSG